MPRNAKTGTGLTVVMTALLLAAFGSVPASAAQSGPSISQDQSPAGSEAPVTLEFWSWLPNMQNEVDLFEAAHPNITVNLTNQGGGSPQYTKLRAAIQAGQVPDVAQIEYQYLPSFQSAVVDLAQYGANDLKPDFDASVWGQITSGDVVHALPQDTGPMGMLYRADLLQQAGVQPPTTWADFATAAQAVKDKTGAYITNLASSDPGALIGLLWQGGARPFSYDGATTVGVNIDSPEAQKVMDYWNTLIQKDLVSTDADFNDAWYQGLNSGHYASWLTAAWGPVYLEGAAPDTSGKWTAAKLPQWNAGEDASGAWGGSSYAVINGSQHAEAAYELAKFITHDPELSMMMATKQSEFPPLLSTLNSPDFLNQTDPFFGGQAVNKLFADISPTVDSNFQWLPFMDFVYTSYNETLGKALADKTDLSAGLTAWQDAVSTYATQQGFTVSQ